LVVLFVKLSFSFRRKTLVIISNSAPELPAVAVVIYKRPEETKRLYVELAKIKPKRLYVIADAPKTPEDESACDQAWSIATHPNWSCDIHKNRSSENLGCRNRVSSGLNWLFEHETEAIILEDDLVPHPDFFRFAAELLERYRNNQDIWHISGNNHQNGIRRTTNSYTFSKHTHCWGWATWKRAWSKYEADMHSWPTFRESNELKKLCSDPLEREYFTKWLDWVHKGERDSWAYVWTYSMWLGGGMGINPEQNLVSNIGFGDSATHTKNSDTFRSTPATPLDWPLLHPTQTKRCEEADSYTFYKHFEGDDIVAARSFRGKLRHWRNGIFRRLENWTNRP